MLKQSLLFILKITISIGVIYFLSQKVDIHTIYNLFRNLEKKYLLFSIICIVIAQLLFTNRWQKIIAIHGPTLPIWQLFKQVYIGFFMGQGLPSIVGGDVFRAMMLKDSGIPLLWGTQTLIIDRICGMIALTLLSVIFLPLKFSVLIHSSIGVGILSVIAVLSCCFLGVIFFHKISILRLKFLQYFYDLSSTFHNFILNKNFVATFTWSVGGMFLHLLSMFFLAQGLGLKLMLSEIITGASIILLITALPISFAGWGLREGAMVLTFSAFNVSSSESISLSILLGGVQLLAALPGLVFWLLYKNSSKNYQGHSRDACAH